MNAWQARREARAERFRQYADNARSRSEARFNTADRMSSCIPMGQPILIGHHSEGRDRRFRARIDNNVRKGFEEQRKAEYFEQRADAAESNDAIYKQDPEAVTKLREKIAELEKTQETMKAINKALKKGDYALAALGYAPEQISEIKKPDCFGCVGYADYKLKNNNANIRRLKLRLESIQREQARPETSESIGAVEIRENAEWGSVEIHFPGKPDQAVIDRLKQNGFKWARQSKCWYKNRRDDFTLELARRIVGGAA